MLGLHAPSAALALVMVASMALAQSGESGSPESERPTGLDAVEPQPQPLRVMTLEEKKRLLAFCTQSANFRDARCVGLVNTTRSEDTAQGR